MNHLPNTSFLQSHHARIELARQRFFEEGQVPTGVVGPAVFESWSRCLRLHGNPQERAEMLAPDGRRGLVAHGPRNPEGAAPAPAVGAHTATARDSAEAADPPKPAPPAPTQKRLRESDLDLIQSTLQDCGGNVSEAAQRLGVSRGLLYRRLRASRAASRGADT